MNPEEADVFYVPYYGAHACFCMRPPYSQDKNAVKENVELLFDVLNKSPYYKKGYLHLMALGKIEREMVSSSVNAP